MKSDQKDIESILASLAEACHDLIPPTEIEPIIKKLFDNFINDTFPPNYITIGLKTLMEITERCPYCLNDGEFSVVNDLRGFKNKSVSNAARAIVNLYKERKENNENFDYGNNKIDYGIEGIELLKKLEKKPKEYKMEYEELLSDKQLKQLKALKVKYAAELIQHKKIKDEDVIKNVPKQKNNNNDNNEENNEEEIEDGEELEEIEDDEELEEIEDENEENEENEKNEKNENNENENENNGEEELELEEIDDEDLAEEESIELDDEDLEQEEESSESFNKIQGFVDPDELNAFKRTRKERIEEIRNAQKEKFVLNKKRKRENTSKTNKVKLKLKPWQMVMPKKRLEQKKKQDKIESLNKKIRSLKQQVGRFKRGKMVLKKKGGKTTKLKKRK